MWLYPRLQYPHLHSLKFSILKLRLSSKLLRRVWIRMIANGTNAAGEALFKGIVQRAANNIDVFPFVNKCNLFAAFALIGYSIRCSIVVILAV